MLGRGLTGKAASDAPDLVEALLTAARSSAPKHRILCITGPPGSGKSRAVAEFVRRCGEDAFSLSLTEDDTALFAFVFALVRCMGPIARGAQLSFNAMQTRLDSVNPIPQIVSWLGAHIDANAWVAVDNVELIETDSRIGDFMLAMVERCPRVRWLFAGRAADGLPLGAWMAQKIANAPLVVEALGPVSVMRSLERVDETERELLAAVAPLRTLEPRLIDAILGEAGNLLFRRLFERIPALFEVNGSVRLHRDVRGALIGQLHALGEIALQTAVTRCGAALEAFELYEELLQMYLRNGASAQLEDIMARRGLALADHVNSDTLDAALRFVSTDSPGVRSVQAMLASRRGQYEVADALFETAACEAAQPLAAQIQYAYGCDLLKRNRVDCAPIFEHLLHANIPGGAHQSEIRSALAQAYVLSGHPVAALEQIKFALHVLRSGVDQSVIKTRAAYVYFYAAHDLARAERIASDALAQALQGRAYTVAVGAASLLYNIACERDRPKEAVAALNVLADCGIKLGSVAFQSYAVIAMLEYHVEAGSLPKIAHAMETLRAFDISVDSLAASESLVTAEAMQRSWFGDFVSAYELLEPTMVQVVSQDYLALREAQLAFFASGAHQLHASREHAARALMLLQAVDPNAHKATRARIFLGIAMSANGDVAEAEKQFHLCSDAVTRFPRLACVRETALLLHRALHGEENTAALRDAFARMHQRGAGGFAMMFDEFPRPSPRLDDESLVIPERPLIHRPA